jgi:heme A synthase
MLFYAHSGVRYLVLLAGVLTLAYALFGAVTRRPYDPMMLRLSRVFAGSVHLQVLLGIALILTGRFYPALIGHIMTMVFAAVAATVVPAITRRRDPAARGWLPHVIGTALTLALIWLGIIAIGRSPLGMGTPGG